MYEASIVTFIDILGFRNLVNCRPAESVAKIVDVFRNRAGDPDANDPLGLKVTAFSDSIIRARPQSISSGLFYELLGLLHAQGELIANGVLVRGGMALGDVTWTPDRVFGPGFIEAYELESQFAIYPRIVVSPGLLKNFAAGDVPFADHHSLSDEAQYIRNLLTQGDDGVWFIDYLRAFRSELDDEAMYPKYLQNHRKIILDLVEQLEQGGTRLSSLSLKVNWLAKYHDSVVNELDEEWLEEWGITQESMLVSHNAAPSLFAFDGVLPRGRSNEGSF